MLTELDMVVVVRDVPEQGVRQGAFGTIVHVYSEGEAFEVEFTHLDSRRDPLATLLAKDVRKATSLDLQALRQTQEAAK